MSDVTQDKLTRLHKDYKFITNVKYLINKQKLVLRKLSKKRKFFFYFLPFYDKIFYDKVQGGKEDG